MRPVGKGIRCEIIFTPAFLAWITACCLFCGCNGQTYEDMKAVFDDKLGPGSGYKTSIRPVKDHSEVTIVHVTFDIIAIVEIEAITQRFVVNGFLGLIWEDQLLAWNVTKYKNVTFIHPFPSEIWRPRVILANTIEARDLFEDDFSPVTAYSSGFVTWHPGSLFPTSCKLNLYKYPFDQQKCHIEMYTMGLTVAEMEFESVFGVVGMDYFVQSGEWSIEETSLIARGGPDPNQYSSFKIEFKLRRLPGFFIVNIVTPIVLMSFLNILVFIIPVDSGEKISYGITVLLALTVFMSIVSEQLPRSSDTLPVVTLYLLVLTVISVCTVMVSIAIVFCHHREEKEIKHQKAASGFKSAFQKFRVLNNAAKSFSKVQVKPSTTNGQYSNSPTTPNGEDKHSSDMGTKGRDAIFNVLEDLEKRETTPSSQTSNSVNRWRLIGKHINCIAFVVFTIIWISVTLGFLVEMAR